MTTLAMRSLRTASLQCASIRPQPRPVTQPLLSQNRHASATSKPSPKRSSSKLQPASTTVASLKPHFATTSENTVNGPTTTLPAPLALPERAPGEPFFPKYAFQLGKAYASFYKTGVKNIWTNFKAAQKVQANVDKKYKGKVEKAAKEGALTRRDYQLLLRSWFDVKRVPIFAVVFIVCGEFTPLVVIAFSGVVPWTCRIPKQIESDRKKLEKRRSISFRNLTAEPPIEKGLDQLQRQQLLHISWSLGLSSSLWDWLGGQYPGLPNSILKKKVQDRINYLEMDDKLIGNADKVNVMDTEEVKIALVERGVDVLGKNEKELRGHLTSWLKSTEKIPIERLLLTRPSVWPSK